MSSKLNNKDTEMLVLTGNVPVNGFGTFPTDFVEVHVYDSEGVLLKSSRTSDYIIGGEIKMQPGSDLRRMGFRRGKYKEIGRASCRERV